MSEWSDRHLGELLGLLRPAPDHAVEAALRAPELNVEEGTEEHGGVDGNDLDSAGPDWTADPGHEDAADPLGDGGADWPGHDDELG
jgi:hypothetical protein